MRMTLKRIELLSQCQVTASRAGGLGEYFMNETDFCVFCLVGFCSRFNFKDRLERTTRRLLG